MRSACRFTSFGFSTTLVVDSWICLGIYVGAMADDPIPPSESLEGVFPAQRPYSPDAG